MKKNLFFAVITLFLFACNSNKNRIIAEDVAAFVESNSSVSYFGYVDVKSILDKAEYQSIEKFGSAIAKEVMIFEKLIGKDQPIYFAVESTTDLNMDLMTGVPAVYAFAEVTNRDSLVANIQKKGFDMEKSKAFDLHESGDVAFAITDHRVVFVTKPSLKEGKKLIEKAIDDLQGSCPTNKVKDILTTKGDIVLGTDYSATYQGLENNIKLDESKKKELRKMTDNSYSLAILKFEIGAINIELKNFISNEMKSIYALGSNSQNVVSKLGSGPVQAAFAMNADMKKIQSFIDKFAPNLMEQIGENAGGQAQFALAMLGDEGLAGLFSGKLGIALMGKPDNTGAYKPEFNFYVELGNSILPMVKGISNGIGSSMAKFEMNGNKINGFTAANYLPGKNGLNLPNGCGSFGSKPISGFINFDGLDMSNFDLDGNERYLKLFNYLTFEMDVDGGSIHFEVKDKKKNVLKVIVDEASQDIKDRVNS
jgi:hypothetical protein